MSDTYKEAMDYAYSKFVQSANASTSLFPRSQNEIDAFMEEHFMEYVCKQIDRLRNPSPPISPASPEGSN